ncbi:hypothetical protein MKW92_020085 [Papaver armeniacum]|nr:hypothetical protein MKW92_020085 [Papaver armeniacum]
MLFEQGSPCLHGRRFPLLQRLFLLLKRRMVLTLKRMLHTDKEIVGLLMWSRILLEEKYSVRYAYIYTKNFFFFRFQLNVPTLGFAKQVDFVRKGLQFNLSLHVKVYKRFEVQESAGVEQYLNSEWKVVAVRKKDVVESSSSLNKH